MHPRPRSIVSSKFYITSTQLRNMEEEVVSVSRLVVYRCRLHVARGLPEYARALSLSRIAKHASTAANPHASKASSPLTRPEAQPRLRRHQPVPHKKPPHLPPPTRPTVPPHLRVFPDVVVRAHQVGQQEVELLLFRHCKSRSKKKTSRVEERRDEPGGSLLRSHNTAGALLAGFIASSRRSLKRAAGAGPTTIGSHGSRSPIGWKGSTSGFAKACRSRWAQVDEERAGNYFPCDHTKK